MTQTHIIIHNSRHFSSFLKILLTRTVSLVAFLNFPCLVLTFSSVSFLNYFNPGIVFCSTTTRGWARSMRPSRPFAWDLWKRNIFCHTRISYIYFKLNFLHTYLQLKIVPIDLFWQWLNHTAKWNYWTPKTSLIVHFQSCFSKGCMILVLSWTVNSVL